MNVLPRYVALAALAGAVPFAAARAAAQTAAPAPTAIAGAWTLNPDLSDKPPASNAEGDQSGRRRGGGGGYGRGGFGGGMRGGGGRRGGGGNPEDMQRARTAIRDELTAPDHLTIVQADATIVITTGDGRTTRLSPDGKKVKEENTGIERKTKWDSGSLVSEVSGVGSMKITETYTIDPDTHNLRVTVHAEGGRMQRDVTLHRVYDGDKQ